ncbi:MAG: phospholipid carrier-dependent glycosyltransferase [Chloroflexi bacterium]|nr:phospholipid carrier-dependent glycosyltransferase [Chloroflexota bacterium]
MRQVARAVQLFQAGGQRISMSALLFLFFFSIYAFTMSGRIQFGDEIEKYRVAQSIVERQQFSFRPTATRNEAGVGGRTYSIYELGQTILEIPFYAIGKVAYSIYPTVDANWIAMLFVGLLNPILTALTCVVLYHTCLGLDYQRKTALWVTLAFGLGTIAWPYSRSYTREPLLALLILASFYSAYLFKKTQLNRWIWIAGLASGYLAFSKFIHGVVIPIILIYILIITYQKQKRSGVSTSTRIVGLLQYVFIFLSPILFFGVAQALYSWARFQNVYIGFAGTKFNPVDWVLQLVTLSEPLTATIGLLFSQEKSLLLYSPIIVLFVLGWFYWLRRQPLEAAVIGVLVVVEFVEVVLRPDWDGGSWWGPRYLVQIVPLCMLGVGSLLQASFSANQKWFRLAFGALFAIGVWIQIVGAFTSERDALNIVGGASTLARQLDFLAHGLIDSLVIYFSPTAPLVQVNPFGILLIGIILLLAVFIWAQGFTPTKPSYPINAVFLILFSLVVLGGFVAWIVVPYSRILTAKGNVRLNAAQNYSGAGETCKAVVLYEMALDWGTTFQHEATTRISQFAPLAKGTQLQIEDYMSWTDITGTVKIENDPVEVIGASPSMRFSTLTDQNATAIVTSSPIQVNPKMQYELSGWLKSSSIYGTGYGVVTLIEDNGNWEDKRSTDIEIMDETHGWQLFRGTITTLPTTKRLFVKVGLFNTFGTLWVDGIRLIQVDPRVPYQADPMVPCK